MGWEKSTIAMLLRRLQKKGVISMEEREIHYYAPNISREEYVKYREKSLINKLYEGSTKKFIAAFCQSGDLTEDDIDELKMFFQGEKE